jgi:hypothetical protein
MIKFPLKYIFLMAHCVEASYTNEADYQCVYLYSFNVTAIYHYDAFAGKYTTVFRSHNDPSFIFICFAFRLFTSAILNFDATRCGRMNQFEILCMFT